MCDNMKRLFFAIFINFLLLNSVSAQHKFTYRTEKLTTCDSIFLVDLSLDNEANKFVFDNVRDALKMAEKVRANGLKRKIRIFLSVGCMGDGGKGGSHVGIDSLVGKDFPGGIHKQDVHTGAQQRFLPAVTLADAAFEKIALNGAFEVSLGDRYHNA